MTLTVSRIDHKTHIRDWLDVPHIVYAGDPDFVPQLDLIEKQRITPSHAPLFKFGEAVFFVAYRDGKPVGRCSAHINRRYLDQYKDATGHFGFFDCKDDTDAAQGLLAAAAQFLSEKGMRRMTGPYNFSANEECGCLIDGFTGKAAILMPAGAPWIPPLLEGAGLAKEMDLYAYRAKPVIPSRIEMLCKRAEQMGKISLRQFDTRRFAQEIELLVEIFNDAWSGNWGFVPFARAEIDAMANEMKPFLRSEYGRFLMIDGKEVGVIVGLPDINNAIADFGGKLLPFNWAKLIWSLKRETVKSGRIPLMGIRRAWHSSPQAGGLLALMVKEMVTMAQERFDLDWVEYSWVLEINKPMCALGELLAGPPAKTYRIYSKVI